MKVKFVELVSWRYFSELACYTMVDNSFHHNLLAMNRCIRWTGVEPGWNGCCWKVCGCWNTTGLLSIFVSVTFFILSANVMSSSTSKPIGPANSAFILPKSATINTIELFLKSKSLYRFTIQQNSNTKYFISKQGIKINACNLQGW